MTGESGLPGTFPRNIILTLSIKYYEENSDSSSMETWITFKIHYIASSNYYCLEEFYLEEDLCFDFVVCSTVY